MTEINFEIVRPLESHARLIMQWRNEPSTLAMSFHQSPKIWETFYPEFINSYFSFPDLPPIFVWIDGQRCAFLRFKPIPNPIDLSRKCCDISIIVAPEIRGKGIGQQILKEIQSWVAQQGYDDLYALVKIENAVSCKAFLHAGYNRLENITYTIPDTDEKVQVCQFIVHLTPERKNKVFVIAEAGSNWRVGNEKGDMEMAKSLIQAGADAGANAVKFQVFRPKSVYVPNAGFSNYLSKAGIVKDISEIFKDLSMPYEMIPELAAHCKKVGVQFMASVFSKKDFEAVDPYVEIHKIASYENNHIRLLELAAASRKPIFMSTGVSLEHEIGWSLETIKGLGGGPVTLLQCTAKYPAESSAMHLKTIPWLKTRFKTQVGLSDHSRDPLCAPLAAVALGAQVIEKHFTMDRKLSGPDHYYAIEPKELSSMVTAIRQVEQMLGSDVKIIDPCEEELRYYCKRGIQAIKDIAKGEIFHEGINIDILRAGNQPRGVHPRFITTVEGKSATRNIPLGSGLQPGDW